MAKRKETAQLQMIREVDIAPVRMDKDISEAIEDGEAKIEQLLTGDSSISSILSRAESCYDNLISMCSEIEAENEKTADVIKAIDEEIAALMKEK